MVETPIHGAGVYMAPFKGLLNQDVGPQQQHLDGAWSFVEWDGKPIHHVDCRACMLGPAIQ